MPVIPISVGCSAQHITCLDCFVRLRFESYVIRQCGNVRVTLKTTENKDSCPECQQVVDFRFVSPGRNYLAMFEMYKCMAPEFENRSEQYTFCNCVDRKRAHANLLSQLQCVTCKITCPFAKECNFQTKLSEIDTASMLTEHLKTCNGYSFCHECDLKVKNSELQTHLDLHRKWIKISFEMIDMREVLFSSACSMRMHDEKKIDQVLQLWKLFKVYVFRQLAPVENSPFVDPLFEKIQSACNDVQFEGKNVIDGLYTLVNTDSIGEDPDNEDREHDICDEAVEDFLAGSDVVFSQPEKCLSALNHLEAPTTVPQTSKKLVKHVTTTTVVEEMDMNSNSNSSNDDHDEKMILL
jgi:hypothetical protein